MKGRRGSGSEGEERSGSEGERELKVVRMRVIYKKVS